MTEPQPGTIYYFKTILKISSLREYLKYHIIIIMSIDFPLSDFGGRKYEQGLT